MKKLIVVGLLSLIASAPVLADTTEPLDGKSPFCSFARLYKVYNEIGVLEIGGPPLTSNGFSLLTQSIAKIVVPDPIPPEWRWAYLKITTAGNFDRQKQIFMSKYPCDFSAHVDTTYGIYPTLRLSFKDGIKGFRLRAGEEWFVNVIGRDHNRNLTCFIDHARYPQNCDFKIEITKPQ